MGGEWGGERQMDRESSDQARALTYYVREISEYSPQPAFFSCPTTGSLSLALAHSLLLSQLPQVWRLVCTPTTTRRRQSSWRRPIAVLMCAWFGCCKLILLLLLARPFSAHSRLLSLYLFILFFFFFAAVCY